MILSEQSAVVLEAIRDGFIQPEDVVRWADTVIESMKAPPIWLIELSALKSTDIVDFDLLLRKHAPLPLPIRRQIEVIVLAYSDNLISLCAALPLLFRTAIIERGDSKLDALGQRLCDTLITWDCLENSEVIDLSLQVKFREIFQEYLMDANTVLAVVPWRLRQRTESGATPNSGPATLFGNSGTSEHGNNTRGLGEL